jgi:hypothetical protein
MAGRDGFVTAFLAMTKNISLVGGVDCFDSLAMTGCSRYAPKANLFF